MTQPGDLTCRELIEFLADYLDGALAADRRALFERHLRVCPSCVNYVETYAATVRLGKAAFANPDAPASSEAPEGLIRAILEARRRR